MITVIYEVDMGCERTDGNTTRLVKEINSNYYKSFPFSTWDRDFVKLYSIITFGFWSVLLQLRANSAVSWKLVSNFSFWFLLSTWLLRVISSLFDFSTFVT